MGKRKQQQLRTNKWAKTFWQWMHHQWQPTTCLQRFFTEYKKITIYYACPDLHGAAGSGTDDKLLIRLLPFHRGSIFFLKDKLFPKSFWNQRGGVLLSEGRTASVVPAVTPTKQHKSNHMTVVQVCQNTIQIKLCRRRKTMLFQTLHGNVSIFGAPW